jgi:hypothetical protein
MVLGIPRGLPWYTQGYMEVRFHIQVLFNAILLKRVPIGVTRVHHKVAQVPPYDRSLCYLKMLEHGFDSLDAPGLRLLSQWFKC